MSIFPGCEPLLSAKVPMDAIYYRDSGGVKKKCLLVFLHGRGGSTKDFEEGGFVQDIKMEGLAADAVAVGTHFGYYANRSIVARLKEDVIRPARAEGYEQIWLVGVSMGGLGALLYTRAYPDDVTGLLLLAPYLGDPPVIREISEAGGLKKWAPGSIDKDDWQRELWRWLKTYTSGHENIYLAYGLNDRLAPTGGLLAEALPAKQVFTANGGHDWPTWRSLWQAFIKKAGLPR